MTDYSLKIKPNRKKRLFIWILSGLVIIFFSIGLYKSEHKPQRSKSNEIKIDSNILWEFNKPEEQQILLRHLMSSAHWDVWRADALWIADYRDYEDGILQGAGIYSINNFTPQYLQYRIRIHIGSYPDDVFEYFLRPGNHSAVNASDSFATLDLTHPSEGTPGFGSYIIISAGSVHLEIYEQSMTKSREFTEKTISKINHELTEVLKRRNEIFEHGFIKELIPKESVILQKEPEITIRQAAQKGIYSVDCYANPETMGRIYYKVYSLPNNVQLSAERISDHIQYIGWSKNPANKFFGNTVFTVYEGDWNNKYNARFELWFKPENGGNEFKLAEKTTEIYGWER